MARTPSGNIKVNVYVDARVLEALRKISAARGTTYSELIREACRLYVLQEGPKVLLTNTAIKEIGNGPAQETTP